MSFRFNQVINPVIESSIIPIDMISIRLIPATPKILPVCISTIILSFNNYEIKNLGGYFGANISEVLLQLFGYNSFLICIVLISWSYKLFFTKNLEFFLVGG